VAVLGRARLQKPSIVVSILPEKAIRLDPAGDRYFVGADFRDIYFAVHPHDGIPDILAAWRNAPDQGWVLEVEAHGYLGRSKRFPVISPDTAFDNTRRGLLQIAGTLSRQREKLRPQ
jgi:hypothetical protein